MTGLTALTTYTIQVAAMTSKGQGQLSASTISSGVPPGLIKAPDPIRVFPQVHEGFISSALFQNCLVLQPTWLSPTLDPAPSPCSTNPVTMARPPFPVGLWKPRQEARRLLKPTGTVSVPPPLPLL